ncbi:hypothetical protein [Burkholderia arboris]|uniref:hypothetical protein n=1 Tax=Burkholderia arboris TaxID=488730 RepID=UPI00210BFD52|nr:hypothetical protein [Burkholderia arboris]UTV56095.1 hypothetical protein NLX30_06870 [Burkholderia arboris]
MQVEYAEQDVARVTPRISALIVFFITASPATGKRKTLGIPSEFRLQLGSRDIFMDNRRDLTRRIAQTPLTTLAVALPNDTPNAKHDNPVSFSDTAESNPKLDSASHPRLQTFGLLAPLRLEASRHCSRSLDATSHNRSSLD